MLGRKSLPCSHLVVALLSITAVGAQSSKPNREPDVPYVPTTEEAVQAMLKLAGVEKSDVVYDLGCGDGRIVIAAAKSFGARGVGIDINPVRIRESEKECHRMRPASGELGVIRRERPFPSRHFGRQAW